MQTVEVELGTRSYSVIIGPGVLWQTDLWQRFLTPGKTLIVSNDRVAPLYMELLLAALPKGEVQSLVLPDGEASKTVTTWSRIIDALVDMKAGRDTCVIALGGGVIGDLCGFAAASYMRGIRFIQAPTSLLAQVDASVGGKTGVNHPSGKNLIGAFHQPSAVLIGTDTLATLPEREFRAGMAEVAKYGAIHDRAFFDWLEAHVADIAARKPETITQLIERSVSNKAEVVAADEREAGRRALLNFGHSFAHALETVTSYERFLHGEAVAVGMVIAAELSERRGLCEQGQARRMRQLLQKLGLPVSVPVEIPVASLLNALALDKKNLAGKTRLILIHGLGDAFVDDSSGAEDIAAAIEACRT